MHAPRAPPLTEGNAAGRSRCHQTPSVRPFTTQHPSGGDPVGREVRQTSLFSVSWRKLLIVGCSGRRRAGARWACASLVTVSCRDRAVRGHRGRVPCPLGRRGRGCGIWGVRPSCRVGRLVAFLSVSPPGRSPPLSFGRENARLLQVACDGGNRARGQGRERAVGFPLNSVLFGGVAGARGRATAEQVSAPRSPPLSLDTRAGRGPRAAPLERKRREREGSATDCEPRRRQQVLVIPAELPGR